MRECRLYAVIAAWRAGDQVEDGEYARLAAVEDRMWWFFGARSLMTWALRDAGPPPGPVLDAGCGTGGLLQWLRDAMPDRLCVGLDMAPAALHHARRREGACLVGGSVNNLPFANASLAAIMSADVLCHRNVDPGVALAESARTLMPGGVLILNLPAYEWMKSTHDHRVHNIRRFIRRDIAALLARSGLLLRRATYWNAFLLPLLVLWRLAGSAKTSDVRPYPPIIDLCLRRLLDLERWIIRYGGDFPLGSSILAVAVKP
ncbi:class I SAM-dependent methyltransferase [Niveispirillum sp. KHB5.9]|uniref:class I SAM-dependent methyltransferase n=1 Tax=Niveispirillum sp. KHB5.9 TaxID=3400269 RepID=UPI003A8A3ED8